jgi:hypothetical protein
MPKPHRSGEPASSGERDGSSGAGGDRRDRKKQSSSQDPDLANAGKDGIREDPDTRGKSSDADD